MSQKKKEVVKKSAKIAPKKKKQKEAKTLSDTWVGSAYHLTGAFRVANQVYKSAHPATYFKMAKDNIAMPLVQQYASNTVQHVVLIAGEVVECVISPPVYMLNKVATGITTVAGSLVKNELNLQHPELRALVDVACREKAHQATHRFFKFSNSQRLASVTQNPLLIKFQSKL